MCVVWSKTGLNDYHSCLTSSSQVSFVELLFLSSFDWTKLHHFRALLSPTAHSSDAAPMEELSSHWISITNTGKRVIYKLQIGRNLSHCSHARGLHAHCFPLWSQVSCRGESIMAFGYSCKASGLTYGRTVFHNDLDLWYRSNPERLFFRSASGHHTLGHLLIPASLGQIPPVFFTAPELWQHSGSLCAPAWPVWGSSVNWACCGTLAFFFNVGEHSIWLLKEYKNHVKL